MTDEKQSIVSRRKILKSFAIGSGAIALAKTIPVAHAAGESSLPAINSLLLVENGCKKETPNLSAIGCPSFESASCWIENNSGSFGVDTISASFAGLPTNGSSTGRVYSGSGSTINSGQYGQMSQVVDLSTISSLMFDAGILTLLQSPSGQVNTLMSFLQAQVLINNSIVWSSNSGGTFLNQTIDTIGYCGTETLAFRLAAISDSNGENTPRISSSWYMFDNIRVT